MLIKFRFIGLLLMLVLNTFVFGQNYNQRSFSELQKELTYYTNVVNDNGWWFVPASNEVPVAFPRKDAINVAIQRLISKGTYMEWQLDDLIRTLQDFSNNTKYHMRNTYIPQLQEQIRHHPDNPNNPNFHLNPFDPNVDPSRPESEPIEAQTGTCHSQGKPGPLWIGDANRQTGWKCHYYSNGQLNYERQYKNGVQHGTSNRYLKSGHPENLSVFWNGKTVKRRNYSRMHPGKLRYCWDYEADGSKTSCMPK